MAGILDQAAQVASPGCWHAGVFFVEKETTSPPHAPVLESGLVIIIKMKSVEGQKLKVS